MNQSPRGPGASSISSSSSCGAPHGATAATGIGAAASARDRDDVAGAQRAGAEPGEQIRRPRSEHGRRRRVRRGRPDSARAPCANQSRCSSSPAGQRCASYGSTSRPPRRIRPHAPVTANQQVDVGGGAEAAHRDLDARGALGVAQQPVGGAQGGAVERPRRRDAEGCRARPAEILQRREQPGLDHADPAAAAARRSARRSARPGAAGLAGELAHRAEAHARPGCQKRRGRGIRIEQRRVRRADQPPAAGGLARIGAGEPGGEARPPRRARGCAATRGAARRTASRG